MKIQEKPINMNNSDKSNNILRTENLSFMDKITYPDLTIQKKSTVFIRGESGSGKSTLLKLFSGLENPSSGTIYYNDIDIKSLDTIKLRQEVLMSPQSFYLFDGTIKDNFQEYYSYRELPVIDDEKIKEYLDICMLDEKLDKDTLTMSGGERQRVFTSICLSLLPEVIMLDEPTSALDEVNAHQMLMNIRDFTEKHDMTLIVVSHDKKLSHDFADQIIDLSGGEHI